MLVFFELNLINLISKLFIDDTRVTYAAPQQNLSLFNMNKPLSKSPFFLVFSRKMSTKITTDNLDVTISTVKKKTQKKNKDKLKPVNEDIAFKE